MTKKSKVHHYFVDEAGDTTLFNKKWEIIVGNPGVSKFFMLGVALVSDPQDAKVKLEKLRNSLLQDPYFKGVPSMSPAAKKTALFFHACDDLQEVRREVLKILMTLDIRVQVIIRRKIVLANSAKSAYENFGNKQTPNAIYDDMVKRLFKNLLHKADINNIVFARRGKSDRLEALTSAIEHAKRNFEKTYQISNNSHVTLRPAHPHEFIGLQIIDYYLWALQRMYERHEDRFFQLLAPQYRLIMDIDNKENNPYGEWYSDSNPLILKKIKSSVD